MVPQGREGSGALVNQAGQHEHSGCVVRRGWNVEQDHVVQYIKEGVNSTTSLLANVGPHTRKADSARNQT